MRISQFNNNHIAYILIYLLNIAQKKHPEGRFF